MIRRTRKSITRARPQASIPRFRRIGISVIASGLAFGSGAHHCVGAFLGRQEMVSSFNVLLSRLKNIELARPLPTPVHDFSLFFIPMKELYIRFDKYN